METEITNIQILEDMNVIEIRFAGLYDVLKKNALEKGIINAEEVGLEV